MSNYAMPSHLTGEMSTLWGDLKNQAGANPEAVIKVTDPAKFTAIQGLSIVGGCTYTENGDAYDVTLMFEPEGAQTEIPTEAAVAKPHKFA
jgi:hypothetical protein